MIHLIGRGWILSMRVEPGWLRRWWDFYWLLRLSRLLLIGISAFVVCIFQADGCLRNSLESNVFCSQLVYLLVRFREVGLQFESACFSVHQLLPRLIKFTLKILVSRGQC